jgi:hypothetical protein
METRGEGATVQPWVWVAMLFFSPVIGSLAWQWHLYTSVRVFFSFAKGLSYWCVKTGCLVRAQAMMTQLIFEHALRIRMKTETGSSTSDKGKRDTDDNDAKDGSKKVGEKSDGNIVGKINTLVGTDLDNIMNGRDFLMLSEWQGGLVHILF